MIFRELSSGRLAFLLSIIIFVTLIFGCSGTGTVAPKLSENAGSTEPGTGTSDRYLMGYYRCTIDAAGNLTAIPLRAALIRLNAIPFVTPPNCSDCISTQVLEFKPAKGYLIAAVTLKNPTSIPGYDIRGILMSDNDPPHDILNRDGYTEQWDNGGPVNRNPFKNFSLEEPFGGGTSVTRVFQVALPVPLNFEFEIAVDASWPGHSKEPYSLKGYVTAQTPQGDMEIVAYAKDWQDDVSVVVADTTEAAGVTTELLFDATTGTWRGDFDNGLGLPDGKYTMWAWAESSNSNTMRQYQKFEYYIGDPRTLADGWPVERGDAMGTGRSSVNGPANGELKWSFAFPGVDNDPTRLFSPVGDTSGNTYVPLPDSLVAVDISGSEKWTFAPPFVTESFTPVLLNDGSILWPVNRSIYGHDLGFLYFLSDDGTQASIPYLLPETLASTGGITPDGNFILPISNGVFLCTPTGYGIWAYIPGDGEFTIPRPPAVDNDGNSYFSTSHNGPNAEIVSLTPDGNERWTSPLNGLPLSQPGLGETGELYAASTAYDFGQLNKFGIQARTMPSGAGLWPNAYSNYLGLSSFGIAVTTDVKVIGTANDDAFCYAVDATDGSFINQYVTFGQLLDNNSAPSVDASGRIFAGVELLVASQTYAAFTGLDASLGFLWSSQPEGNGYIGSPIIGADGYVMCMSVASDDTLELHCFGEM